MTELASLTVETVAPGPYTNGENAWLIGVPGSIALQARPFNGPGTRHMALDIMTSCCRTRVEGYPLRCGRCERLIPVKYPYLALRRGERGLWEWPDDVFAKLAELIDEDLEPLAASVQSSRLADFMVGLLNRIDDVVVPVLHDRRARLPVQQQAHMLTVVVEELREEYEWL